MSVVQNTLQDYVDPLLYYTFSLHWDLTVKPPLLAVILMMVVPLWGQTPDRSLQLHYSLDVAAARSSITKKHVSPSFTSLIS